MQAKVLKNTIDKHFKNKGENNFKLFSELSFYIYGLESPKSDLPILAKLLSREDLINLLSYYDGDPIYPPDWDNYQECVFLAICFYLKEVQNYTWTEIKKFLNLPEQNQNLFSPITIGRKINRLKVQMNKQLEVILNSIKWDEDNIQEFLNKVREVGNGRK